MQSDGERRKKSNEKWTTKKVNETPPQPRSLLPLHQRDRRKKRGGRSWVLGDVRWRLGKRRREGGTFEGEAVALLVN